MFLIVLNVCIVLIILLITLNLVEKLMYIVRGNNNNEIAKTRRGELCLNAFIWSHLGLSI